jgi:hypothetical protein
MKYFSTKRGRMGKVLFLNRDLGMIFCQNNGYLNFLQR